VLAITIVPIVITQITMVDLQGTTIPEVKDIITTLIVLQVVTITIHTILVISQKTTIRSWLMGKGQDPWSSRKSWSRVFRSLSSHFIGCCVR